MDYDIDCVSLAAFLINQSGKIDLWSPYTNISSTSLLNASVKLPFPSGNRILLKIGEAFEEDEKLSIFDGKIGETNLIQIRKDKNGKIYVNFMINDAKHLLQLNHLLRNIGTEFNLISDISVIGDYFRRSYMLDITNDDAREILNLIINLIDNHNLYISNLKSKVKLENILTNFIMLKLWNVSSDPINLIQAQTSVDDTTGPFKDQAKKANTTLNRSGGGNVFEMAEGIVNNQVGKDGIGICAVGLKGMSGIQQYMNYVLEHGTDQQKRRIILGRTGVTIKGKTYKFILNLRINSENIKFILNLSNTLDEQGWEAYVEELKDLINYSSDAAVMASALLSLATDNAKELTLGRLNATLKTLGMYMYGLTIGMNVNDISEIIMSNIGLTISSLMEGNIFNKDLGLFSLNNTFNYFELGPKNLNVFKIKQKGENGRSLTSAYDIVIPRLFELLNKNATYNAKLENDAVLIFAKDNSTRLSTKIKTLDDFRKSLNKEFTTGQYHGSPSSLKFQVNQMIDFIEDYCILWDTLNNDNANYNALKLLSQGAEEMRIIGRVYSLNQGLNTKTEEIINRLAEIKNIIINRKKLMYDERVRRHKADQIRGIDNNLSKYIKNDNDLINLESFISDSNYRERIINDYENIKHSFNIFDAIFTVPHFKEYFSKLVQEDVALTLTNGKYLTIKNLGALMIGNLNITSSKDRERVYRGVLRFYENYLRDDYFINNDITITIPKGSIYFDENGNRNTVENDNGMTIQLGTKHGNATYKLFIERFLIPELKNSNNVFIKNNGFIKALSPQVITRNISHNSSVNYSTGINMMPSTDQEWSKFINLKSEFNKLKARSWTDVNNISHTIPKLLYYYNLITYNGRVGQYSLTRIFEDMLNIDFIKDFYDYEKQFNDNVAISLNETNSNDRGTISVISEYELYPYILGDGNKFTAVSKFIYIKDKFKSRLARKDSDKRSDFDDEYFDLFDDVEYNTVNNNGYSFLDNANIDYDYFTEGSAKNQGVINNIPYNNGTVNLNINNHRITSIEVNNRKILLEKPINLTELLHKSKGKTVIDYISLYGAIDKLLNC